MLKPFYVLEYVVYLCMKESFYNIPSICKPVAKIKCLIIKIFLKKKCIIDFKFIIFDKKITLFKFKNILYNIKKT